MKKKLMIKIPDVVIILLFAALTVYSGYIVFATGASGTPMVVIQGPGNRTWVHPLDTDDVIRVRGTLGDDTVIIIQDGEVWAESSPCHNQVCIGMGRIHAGSWWPFVACLPNNVMFMVEGVNDNTSIDGAAR